MAVLPVLPSNLEKRRWNKTKQCRRCPVAKGCKLVCQVTTSLSCQVQIGSESVPPFSEFNPATRQHSAIPPRSGSIGSTAAPHQPPNPWRFGDLGDMGQLRRFLIWQAALQDVCSAPPSTLHREAQAPFSLRCPSDVPHLPTTAKTTIEHLSSASVGLDRLPHRRARANIQSCMHTVLHLCMLATRYCPSWPRWRHCQHLAPS